MVPPPSVDETIKRFFNIVQDRLSDVTKTGRHKEAWSNTSVSKEYNNELRLLKPHYKPFIWGVCTAVTLFASFRISKYTGKLGRTRTGGYNFEKLSKIEGRKKSDQNLSSALSLPIDLFLSLLVGASASLFLTDEVRMQNDLASVPLVAGRSLISDELCKDFVKEINKFHGGSFSSKDIDQSNTLKTIHLFIDNCQKRDSLVSYREEQGMMSEQATKIPEPGVLDHLSEFIAREHR